MPQANLSYHNSDGSDPSVFFLTGIPGMEDMHLWISIPFCSMFIVALLGNCSLLYVIMMEPSLHKPMFYFLAMLASIDLVLSTSTIPKTLSIFWFNSREISFAACLVQMFFLHSFLHVESGVLVGMAFDRYVAICKPLRYTTILTTSVIAKIGMAFLIRAILIRIPLLFFLSKLPYCRSHVISHCYCEHMAVLKLACADTSFSNIYEIIATCLIVGVDLTFISLSYIKIVRTVLSLASKKEQLKAFNTCVSHLCAILMFYTPVLLNLAIHRFGQLFDPAIHILVATFYFVSPPMMNPIIYGMKTKAIRNRVLLLFQRKSF